MATAQARLKHKWQLGLAPVFRGVGLMLHVPAFMALVSMGICLFFKEYNGLVPLAATFAASLFIGQGLFWVARGTKPIQRRHAMIIAALAWLAIAAVGATPFVLAGYGDWLNGFFESMSGFTTTGMTLYQPAELPHYLQWWRSLSQWIGGVGVILLMLTILPSQRGALDLYLSEARNQKLLPTVRATTRMVWFIYGGFTLIGVTGLWLAGAPIWQAINHGMAGIATGGFTITADGLAGAALGVKLVYIAIMLAGAISFYTHYRVWHERRISLWWTGAEYKLFWCVVIIGAALLALQESWQGNLAWADSLLRWVAAVTTTGALGNTPEQWHTGTLWLLMLAMCVGGIAGSTSGGIKMLRLVTLYKVMLWDVANLLKRPHELLRLRFNGQPITQLEAQQLARAAIALFWAWTLVAFIGVWLMSWCVPPDTPLSQILFDVLSAQSSQGVTTGLVNPELNAGGKILLIALMWMGRLEVMPVLVLIAVAVQRFRRR